MVESKTTISELKKGDKVQGVFFVKNCTCRLTNGSNAKFLDINLMDKTGVVNAKLWDCRSGQDNVIKENMLVNVKGNIVEWKGKLQFKIDAIDPISEEQEVHAEDFIPVAPIDPKVMFEERSEERRVGKECRSRWSP